MAFKRKIRHYICGELKFSFVHLRYYSLEPERDNLRPIILERLKNRPKDYHLRNLIPIANDVVKAREVLLRGASILVKEVPVKACIYCPEVYIGDKGHRIRTCRGYMLTRKGQEHKWADGTLTDILSPVEAFHLKYKSQSTIDHGNRLDIARVPAVLELCYQAGADISEEMLLQKSVGSGGLDQELFRIGQRTVDAWERVRLGVQKLLRVYGAKVCDCCSEVRIGPSVLNNGAGRGAHRWKKAEVDDLVPQKVVWHRRPHDPPVLVHGGQGYYGHAPAVVELCLQAGANIPNEYYCLMKAKGLPPQV